MRRAILCIVAVFAMLVPARPAQGQAALLVLLFGEKVASENFYFSLKVGLNRTNVSGIEGTSARRGINFGLLATIKLSDRLSLVPEFSPLSRKGAEEIPYVGSGLPPIDAVVNPPDESVMDLNYLDVPIILKYQVSRRLSIGTGPSFGFLLTSENLFARDSPDRAGDRILYSEQSQTEWSSFDAGWAGEITYSLFDVWKGKGLNVHARYAKGFTDLITSTPGTQTNSAWQFFVSLPFINPPAEENAEGGD